MPFDWGEAPAAEDTRRRATASRVRSRLSRSHVPPLYLVTAQNGVLIGLSDVVAHMPLDRVVGWRLVDFKFWYGAPLGLTLDDFEGRTRPPAGLMLSRPDFLELLRGDFQLQEGIMYALASLEPESVLFSLECLDASAWELLTDDAQLASSLMHRGWVLDWC